MKTYNLKNVEVFSTGKWNDDNFTTEDLQGMVAAFNETKEGVRPYIKLGHSKKQALAQNDGLPSLGWIDNMYVKGDKLIADLADIPKKVYDLIKVGAYKKVSLEMFFNVKIKEKKFSHLITAVSLLGADTPAVMNLSDIHSMYFGVEEKPKVYFEQALEFKFNELTAQEKETEMPKTEAEIKLELDLEAKQKDFTAQKEKADKLETDKADSDKEIAELKEFKANALKKELEAAEKLRETEIKAFSASLVSEKLATPSMKPLIEQLLSDKKEFSVKVGDKEFKTKEDVLKEAFKLFAAAKEVNFEEKTETTDKTFSADKEKELDKQARKFMSDDKKLNYKQALIKAKKEVQ